MAAIPSFSLPMVPQSVTRPSWEGLPKPAVQSALHATPTRRTTSQSQPSSKYLGLPAVDYGGYLPSSPLQPRRSGQLFATVLDSAVKNTPGPATSHGIQETPIKKRAGTSVHGDPALKSRSDKENDRGENKASNVGMKTMGSSQEESIYKSLGWDDADDLDELQ